MDTFLDLSDETLIQLGISLLIVLFGYFVGGWLLVAIVRSLGRRSANEFVDQAVRAVEPQLRWLALTVSLQLALFRLEFIDTRVRELLNAVFWAIYIAIAFLASWRLVGIGFTWLSRRLIGRKDVGVLEDLLPLLKQFSYFGLVLVFATIALSHYGVNVSALVATLGVAGLAVSLAAKDTLADALSGVLIILDHPFHVGDRIDVADVGAAGDVIDIGLRSSRIRLLDDRLVIVPNGVIARNPIVNYTYPDPIVRQDHQFAVANGSDIVKVQRVVTEAVRAAEGVLEDKPVNVLFWLTDTTGMIFRVEWWVDITAQLSMTGIPVKEVIYRALVDSGIEVPPATYDVNLRLDEDGRAWLSGTLSNASTP
ncbi:MAG TPA: mechanosensitive ion channel domain-containing protein [Anaerolineales bacterium]|nr:mechanosensitive ion channel domain-containing protein [Anaerolineales bacterium]